jgi:hypothetical protein
LLEPRLSDLDLKTLFIWYLALIGDVERTSVVSCGGRGGRRKCARGAWGDVIYHGYTGLLFPELVLELRTKREGFLVFFIGRRGPRLGLAVRECTARRRT